MLDRVGEWMSARESEGMCKCDCICERESECVCKRERDSVSVCARESGSVCMRDRESRFRVTFRGNAFKL